MIDIGQTGGERYLEDLKTDPEYSEAHAEASSAVSYFDSLVEQDENFIEAAAPWAGSDGDKEALLNEIATMALTFSIARITRFQHFKGTPRSLKVRISVEVDGAIEKTESGLILP